MVVLLFVIVLVNVDEYVDVLVGDRVCVVVVVIVLLCGVFVIVCVGV